MIISCVCLFYLWKLAAQAEVIAASVMSYSSAVDGLASILVYVYGIGLLRAWELLGVEQIGLGCWLNPLRVSAPSTSRKDTEKPGSEEDTHL